MCVYGKNDSAWRASIDVKTTWQLAIGHVRDFKSKLPPRSGWRTDQSQGNSLSPHKSIDFRDRNKDG